VKMKSENKPPNNLETDKRVRALGVIELLEKEYSGAKTALKYRNPMELLIATMLSAQTTDKRVNIVTKTLFKKYRNVQDFAKANLRELEQEIKSTGFYHNKAKNIKASAQLLIQKYDSKVPGTMDELLELPGVARKTANIVLQNAYGVIEGIAVDTHVRRISKRLGFTKNEDQNKIEQDLMQLIPKSEWKSISDLLIILGRNLCIARKPKCEVCILNKICPSAFTFSQQSEKQNFTR
jgi:endonuclease-3